MFQAKNFEKLRIDFGVTRREMIEAGVVIGEGYTPSNTSRQEFEQNCDALMKILQARAS